MIAQSASFDTDSSLCQHWVFSAIAGYFAQHCVNAKQPGPFRVDPG
jgi:hypothetical protein